MAQTQDDTRRVLLAGGGTGGHVFPALAVARELLERGWQVSWIGRPEGMERQLVERAGIDYHGLAAGAVAGRGAVAAARALATTAGSAMSACRLVKRLGAEAVLGTGGFVSAPGVLGARLAGRPTYLLEPNARAGLANRWLARMSRKVFTAYDDGGDQFGKRTEVTGVPVRPEFFRAPELVATTVPRRVLVLGGSQGARQINLLMPEVCQRLSRSLPEFEVLHQTGREHFEQVRADYQQRGLLLSTGARIRVVPFLDDVASAMAEAHLVISRAGALTLAEICAAGRPSVLIPLGIAGGHQADNARHLVAAGAAEMLDGEVSSEAVAERVADLLSDPARLEDRAAAARSLARPAAVNAIADVLTGETT